MLPWSWVTWAARSCSLNFKCSQPDYSFPYCDGGGEGFEGQSLLQYTFRRELKIRVLAFEDSAGKCAVLQNLPCCP